MAEAPTIEFEEGGKTWHRVWRVGTSVRMNGIQHRGQTVPVSMSLPLDQRPGQAVNRYGHRVVEHSDGTLSLPSGVRIAQTNRELDLHAKSCGYTHEP
jgi:hypothetical protein